MDVGKWRRKEENLLSSLFSPACIPKTTWSWGAGWILLACFWSAPGQHSLELPFELFSEARSISGNSFSPERRETKQGLSPWNREQATGLTGSFSSFIVLTYSQPELLTSTQRHASEFCILSYLLCGCVHGVRWGHGNYPASLTRGGSNAVCAPPPHLCFDFTFWGSRLASAACLAKQRILKAHLPASGCRQGEDLAVTQLLICARYWARPSACVISPSSQRW